MMSPWKPSRERLALMMKIDLITGTQKETIVRQAVAARVTMKPGVAGRMQLMREERRMVGCCLVKLSPRRE